MATLSGTVARTREYSIGDVDQYCSNLISVSKNALVLCLPLFFTMQSNQ